MLCNDWVLVMDPTEVERLCCVLCIFSNGKGGGARSICELS